MPRLLALQRQWRRHPPLRKLIASLCAAPARPDGAPTASRPTTLDPSGIGGLVARFPTGRVPADR